MDNPWTKPIMAPHTKEAIRSEYLPGQLIKFRYLKRWISLIQVDPTSFNGIEIPKSHGYARTTSLETNEQVFMMVIKSHVPERFNKNKDYHFTLSPQCFDYVVVLYNNSLWAIHKEYIMPI